MEKTWEEISRELWAEKVRRFKATFPLVIIAGTVPLTLLLLIVLGSIHVPKGITVSLVAILALLVVIPFLRLIPDPGYGP